MSNAGLPLVAVLCGRMVERRHEWRRGTHECVRYRNGEHVDTTVDAARLEARATKGGFRESPGGRYAWTGVAY